MDNHERLFKYIDNGILEALDPKTLRPMARAELLELLVGLTDKIHVADEVLPPALITGASKAEDKPRAEKITDPVETPSTPVEEEPVVEEEPEEEELDEAELKKMNRKELDALAKEYDLNPEEYATKGELIDALLEE